MSLAAGTRLGSYEVLAPLGAGGMGEVFRARDTRLGREVAIKALPVEFAGDPERLARFEREARLLASLSHSNIAGIHGLEEVGGHRYLILELVEGETLARRIARGPLPLDETLEVGRQIATALEVAHESGIVHRDLKPGNVMLTPAGAVKVLDFGLAKGGSGSASTSDLSHSPTMTVGATAVGVILGTAAYMSPEQARGRAVDRRTDIWSFGCVLFECLAGRQAFAGETVSDVVARILEREPDWSALPANVPARLRNLLERCLRKDAKERLRDIGDARIELGEIARAGPEPVAAAHRRPAWVVLGAAILGAVLVALASRFVTLGPAPQPLHVSVQGPEGLTLSEQSADLAISPDGRTIAFCAADTAGVTRLWLRPLGSSASTMLPGTEGARLPFWSPDSRDVAFFAAGKLHRVGLGGDDAQLVCEAPNPRGGTWGPGDAIVLAPGSSGPLMRVAASGGEPRPVTTLDSTRGESAHRFPSFLPDGRHFLYSALTESGSEVQTRVGSLDGKPGPIVTTGNSEATYAHPGYLIFLRQATVFAQRFSTLQMRTIGAPRALRDLRDVSGSYSGTPIVSCSGNGTVVQPEYGTGDEYVDAYDRDGRRLRRLSLPPGVYVGPRVSPDGRAVAFEAYAPAQDRESIEVVDLERDVITPLTTTQGVYSTPVWSRDGRRVIYGSDRTGSRDLYMKNADGSGEEKMIGDVANLFNDPNDVTPDDRLLIYRSLSGTTSEDLWTLSLDDSQTSHPLIHSRANELDGVVSPDGHWIAYRSDESGSFEMYVQSFPALDRKIRVSVDGAIRYSNARMAFTSWRRDGRELYFVSRDGFSVMAAEVTPGAALTIGKPHVLVRLPQTAVDAAISPDGERLYVVFPVGATGRPVINVLMNWASELNGAKR